MCTEGAGRRHLCTAGLLRGQWGWSRRGQPRPLLESALWKTRSTPPGTSQVASEAGEVPLQDPGTSRGGKSGKEARPPPWLLITGPGGRHLGKRHRCGEEGGGCCWTPGARSPPRRRCAMRRPWHREGRVEESRGQRTFRGKLPPPSQALQPHRPHVQPAPRTPHARARLPFSVQPESVWAT